MATGAGQTTYTGAFDAKMKSFREDGMQAFWK